MFKTIVVSSSSLNFINLSSLLAKIILLFKSEYADIVMNPLITEIFSLSTKEDGSISPETVFFLYVIVKFFTLDIQFNKETFISRLYL